MTDLRRFPVHGWLGVLLVSAFWITNWSMTGARTHILFFPLWLGYCLTVDGLTVWRRGNSLLQRGLLHYLWLFVLSAALWWVFEAINLRTQNWVYLGGERLSPFARGFWSSLDFSTVVPAVFGTSSLMATFRWTRIRSRPLIGSNLRLVYRLVFVVGMATLVLVLALPRYFYPGVWLSFICILDPINFWLGRPTVIGLLRRGHLQPILCLAIGTLICGFFWEMWNALSWPKWIYHVPFFGFWKIFEMPALGYLGYPPFGLELFVTYHFVTGFARGVQRDLLGGCPRMGS